MQRWLSWTKVALPVLLALTLAGCAANPGLAPTQDVTAAPDFTASRMPDPPADVPPPPVSSPPVEIRCEDGPLGCRIYRSVAGQDASGELGWMVEQPLEVSMVYVNETWTVGVKAPCNHLGVEVELQDGTWVPGSVTATAMGCLGPESGYEHWTHQLFEEPVTWTLDGTSLVLQNSHGTVELQDAGLVRQQ